MSSAYGSSLLMLSTYPPTLAKNAVRTGPGSSTEMHSAELAHHRGQALHEALDGKLSGVIRVAERQSHDAIQTRHCDDTAGQSSAHGRQHGFGDARDPEGIKRDRVRQLLHRERCPAPALLTSR